MISTTSTSVIPQPRTITAGRIWRAAGFAVIAAVIANIVVRIIAGAVTTIPAEFQPLQYGAFIFFTIFGVLGATLVFWLVSRIAKRPLRTFTIIAGVVLLLSFLPDTQLSSGTMFSGVTTAGVITLAVMHVTTAISAVRFLTRTAVKA